MDLFDKAGRAVGDLAVKARERERLRIQDRISLLELIDTSARLVVTTGKLRPGAYGGPGVECEDATLRMVSAALALDDAELVPLVDALRAIDISWGYEERRPAPAKELDDAYRALVTRVGQLRRETFADD